MADTVQQISARGALGTAPKVAVDDSGNIVAAWVMFTAFAEHGGDAHARRCTADTGCWSAVAEMHAPEGMQTRTVDVALNPAGQGMAVMQEWIADRFAVVGNRINARGGYAVVRAQDSSDIWALHCD